MTYADTDAEADAVATAVLLIVSAERTPLATTTEARLGDEEVAFGVCPLVNLLTDSQSE